MARLGSFVSVLKAPLQHFWKEAARTHGGFSDVHHSWCQYTSNFLWYSWPSWPLSTLSWFFPRFFDQVPLLTLHNSNRNREEQKQELKEVFDLCSECILSLLSGCVNVARCRVGNRAPVGSNRGMMSMDQLLSTTLSSRRIVFGDSAIIAGLCAICDFRDCKRISPKCQSLSESRVGQWGVCEGLMQVLGFSSTTREDLILKLLSCFINPLHLCAVHFARIDSIDPVQLSAGLEGTCGNDDGCGQGLRLWNCFEYWILPNAARCGLSFFGCS